MKHHLTTITFDDVRLEISKEGECRVDYGGVRGWETFKNVTAALNKLDRWSETEISRLSKQLAGLAKMRRYITRHRRTA